MIALALGMLAWASLAQAPDYDAFSDRDGHIATEQHHAAAYALVRNPEELEAVYSDAAKGNARARRVWQELEANLSGAGVEVAERSTRAECLVPIYRERSGSCRPDWSFLDYLAKDRPGAAQLRKVVYDAFAARARKRGLENQAILAAASSLVAVRVAGAAVREAGVAAGAARVQPSTAPPAGKAAAGSGGRGAGHLKPDPAAAGPHSTFKGDGQGRVTGHAEWQPNPRNPSGFDQFKRVDTQHANPHTHHNKTTGQEVPTPHAHERSAPGGVRPARPDELPR